MPLESVVLMSYEVDVNNFPVLIHNEFKRSTFIPVGTVVGHLYPIDLVKPIARAEPVTEQFDPNLINSGDSPIPKS